MKNLISMGRVRLWLFLCLALGSMATITQVAAPESVPADSSGVQTADSGKQMNQDSAVVLPREAPDTSNLVLTIDRVTVRNGRIKDTIDITLEAGGRLAAGFDIKVGLESANIEIMEILPGEILDSCTWEFFKAQPVEVAAGEHYPRSLWHIVALAEVVPDETRPHCYGIGRPASLVRIVVSSEHIVLVPDSEAAIFFFWESCADNTVSGVTGNSLLLSSKIYDYFTVGDYESETLFPTRLGAPEQCIDLSVKNPPLRRIEFHNGGVKFEIELGADSTTVDSL